MNEDTAPLMGYGEVPDPRAYEDELVEAVRRHPPEFELEHSPTIANIALALAIAQGKIEGAKKNAENPFLDTTYADLHSVIEASRLPLAESHLCCVQIINPVPNPLELVSITTMLVHGDSGEWFRSVMYMPVIPQTVNETDDSGRRTGKKVKRVDAQCVGIAIAYGRRYSRAAIIGVAQMDGDAQEIAATSGAQRALQNLSAPRPIASTTNQPAPAKAKEPKPAAISQSDVRRLWADACQRADTLLDQSEGKPPEMARAQAFGKYIVESATEATCEHRNVRGIAAEQVTKVRNAITTWTEIPNAFRKEEAPPAADATEDGKGESAE